MKKYFSFTFECPKFSQKNIKIAFAVFIAYILVRLFLLRAFLPPIGYEYFGRQRHTNLPWWNDVNLIPIRNIIIWFQSGLEKFYSRFGRNLIINNIIRPILACIPVGVFCKLLFDNFKKNICMFVLALAGIMGLRVFLGIGYLDIDKIILCSIGFSIGFYIAKSKISILKNQLVGP